MFVLALLAQPNQPQNATYRPDKLEGYFVYVIERAEMTTDDDSKIIPGAQLYFVGRNAPTKQVLQAMKSRESAAYIKIYAAWGALFGSGKDYERVNRIARYIGKTKGLSYNALIDPMGYGYAFGQCSSAVMKNESLEHKKVLVLKGRLYAYPLGAEHAEGRGAKTTIKTSFYFAERGNTFDCGSVVEFSE